MVRLRYVYILFLICALIVPVFADTAALAFTKSLGSPITWTDTNEAGDEVFVGLTNGSIIGYDNVGAFLWQHNTNASIKKIMSNAMGNTVVWSNINNESGVIVSGIQTYFRNDTGRVISDISIMSNGSYYAITENTPSRIEMRNLSGQLIAQNRTFGITKWSLMGFDPDAHWVISINESIGSTASGDTKVYHWNISTYPSWEQMSPIYPLVYDVPAARPPALQFLDSFPYRINFSFGNGTLTSGERFIFTNTTTNTSSIQQLTKTRFEYNPMLIGNYFYWNTPGNYTTPQTDVVVISNASLVNYTVQFQLGVHNATAYFGNTSYVYLVGEA